MRISDWSSDVCSSDLQFVGQQWQLGELRRAGESGSGGDVARVGLQRARIGLRQPVGAAQAFVVAEQLAQVFGHVAHGGGLAFHHVRVEDRKSVVQGKWGYVRVELGGGRIIKKKQQAS